MMRQRMIKAGVLLLGLMVLFTIISRVAYNMSIAEVSTEKPEPQTLIPDISAQGVVTGSREIAVSTVESLRVGTVHVMEGQAVEAGEILFEVDLQDLMEKMKEKQLELQSLDLQIRGSVESEAAAEQSRQLSLSQAQEDYNRTAARENAAVDAALAELQQAQEEYESYAAGAGSGQAGFREAEISQPGAGWGNVGPAGESGSGQAGAGQGNAGESGFGQADSGQTAEQLLAAVQEKQAVYDQAVQNREDSLYNAKKALDSANLGTAKNYSVEQSQITRGQKAEEIAELQALLDVQGRVASPVKGMVTDVSVRAGTMTTGGSDILLSDISGGASLSVTFPEEMRKYVREGSQAVVTGTYIGNGSLGDVGTLEAGSKDGQSGTSGAENQENQSGTSGADGQDSQSETSGAESQEIQPGVPGFGGGPVSDRVTIRTVTDNAISGKGTADMETGAAGAAGSVPGASSGGSFTVTVDLPPEHFSAGETAMLKMEAQPGNYDTCIPAGALHLRQKDQYYVNVAEKRSTILGEEWVIRQIDVKLLEKNERYAAVEGISSGQEVVTEASRALEDGSRVKMKGEK